MSIKNDELKELRELVEQSIKSTEEYKKSTEEYKAELQEWIKTSNNEIQKLNGN